MFRAFFLLMVVIFIAACGSVSTRPSSIAESTKKMPADGGPPQKAFKVVVLILENKDQAEVMQRRKDAPPLHFLQKMIDEGAVLSNYSAITHPSQPNYVALVSGSAEGVSNDRAVALDRDYIGKYGPSWATYAEDYPENGCPLDEQLGRYVRKHVPFLSFKDIQEDKDKRCGHIKNLSGFFAAVQSRALPDISLLIPNLDHDAHDKPLTDADAWLTEKILPVLEDPWFRQEVVFVVTFDEDGSSWPYWFRKTNLVFTALWGDHVRHMTSTDPYNHYSLLRMLEEVFGVKPMRKGDLEANPISGIWK